MDVENSLNKFNLDAENISRSSKKNKNALVIRKVICRYGTGCTHKLDPAHKEKFWHPVANKISDELLGTHYICNECGYATSSLPDLQVHLKRKTAWSNVSLIGCRISCLVDYKEWHEGYVTQFHKSGKHLVEFKLVDEKRWLTMKKVAFYIVERPVGVNCGSEFKDCGDEGLAPIEESWVYCEDITEDYCIAQSILFKIFGNKIQETGHLTKGHICLTDADRSNAQTLRGSLLYGELLPRGANKAFSSNRLDAENASVLYDLGMGTGKIAIQAFVQFKNLNYVYGVELSNGRYKIAEEAVLRIVQLLGQEKFNVELNPGKSIKVIELMDEDPEESEVKSDVILDIDNGDWVENHTENEKRSVNRVLHLECGNMFDVKSLSTADVVMMETDIPSDLYLDLQKLLSSMHESARILTYLDLRRIWDLGPLPFKQLDCNRHLSDRYPTSWSVQRGHHFYLWSKVNVPIDNWTSSLGLNSLGIRHGSSSGIMNDYSINCNASRHKNGMDDHQSSAEEDSIYTRCLPFSFFFRRPTVQIPVDKKKKGKKSKNIDHENNVSPMSATTKLKFTPVIVKKERVIIPINADGSRSSAKPEESSSEANNDAAPRADKVEFVNGVDGNVIPINTVDSDSSTGKSFARSPGKNSSIHLATSTSENPDMSREKTFSDQDDITSQKIVKLIPRSRTNSPSILNVDNSSTREGIQPIVQSLLGDTNSQKLMCNDSSFSGKRQNNEYEDMAPSIDSPSSASFMPLTSEESNCNAVLDGKAGRSRKKSSKKDVFKSNYDAVLPERRTYNDKNVSLDGSQRREHPVSNDVCSTAICNREYNKDDNLKVHSVRQVDQRADAGCILS